MHSQDAQEQDVLAGLKKPIKWGSGLPETELFMRKKGKDNEKKKIESVSQWLINLIKTIMD